MSAFRSNLSAVRPASPKRLASPRRLNGLVVLAVSALLMGVALGPAAFAQGGSDARVYFKSPRHLSTVIGPSTFEVGLNIPAGLTVDKIEIYVDGEKLTTLTSPPWKGGWDAGSAVRGRQLEAFLFLSDGTQSRAVTRTSPLRINQFEGVGLVNLYSMVRDKNGAYVSDLTKRDFQVLENGVPQEINKFSTERKPLRVGIVLDTSLSMSVGKGTKLKNARNAALEFLDVLQPDDEGMVVSFNDSVHVVQDLTKDKSLLADAIVRAESTGGTALYDALWRTSRKLQDFDGRRVIVLLSDGRDEAYEGLQPGSLHTLEEALDQALRSEVMVFTIGLGRRLDSEYVIRWDRNLFGQTNVDTSQSLGSILRRMADDTGGRALISVSAGQLRRAFRNVAEDLRNQYLLAYISNDPKRDGGWREISVSTPEKRLEVVARKGYYAPSDDGGTGGGSF